MESASLFTSMAGLQSLTADMQTIAANLSNQQTPGYAAVQNNVEAADYQGGNAPVGADAVASTTGPKLQQGALIHSNDPMNVALGGDAWLEVQTDSGTALTRDGALSLSSVGILTDSAGNPVLSTSNQPISLPALAKLEIGADGTVSGVPANQPGGTSQVYGRLNLVATPSGALSPLSGTLYLPEPNATLSSSSNGSLHQGYLNASNVDPTQNMMQMIEDSRSYQLQTDLMKNQSSSDQMLNAVLAQG
jgi:flagellar basal-body rod protein FlgF